MSGERLVRELERLASEGVGGARGPAVRWRARLERGSLDRKGLQRLSQVVRRLGGET